MHSRTSKVRACRHASIAGRPATKKAGVAIIAGTSFGAQGEGYVRFSYANSTENIIRDAIARRIREYLSGTGNVARLKQHLRRSKTCASSGAPVIRFIGTAQPDRKPLCRGYQGHRRQQRAWSVSFVRKHVQIAIHWCRSALRRSSTGLPLTLHQVRDGNELAAFVVAGENIVHMIGGLWRAGHRQPTASGIWTIIPSR